jgi:hypothetical protein
LIVDPGGDQVETEDIDEPAGGRPAAHRMWKGRRPMVTLVRHAEQAEAGFVLKNCILCLGNRLHAVGAHTTEIAGFNYATKATLTCTHCGFEREALGEAAKALMASAVSHEAIVETLSAGALEGEFYGVRPAGSEWLDLEDDPRLVA